MENKKRQAKHNQEKRNEAKEIFKEDLKSVISECFYNYNHDFSFKKLTAIQKEYYIRLLKKLDKLIDEI